MLTELVLQPYLETTTNVPLTSHIPDCSVEFCYPTNDVYNPIKPKSGVVLDGATFDETDGGIVLGNNAKVCQLRVYFVV